MLSEKSKAQKNTEYEFTYTVFSKRAKLEICFVKGYLYKCKTKKEIQEIIISNSVYCVWEGVMKSCRVSHEWVQTLIDFISKMKSWQGFKSTGLFLFLS